MAVDLTTTLKLSFESEMVIHLLQTAQLRKRVSTQETKNNSPDKNFRICQFFVIRKMTKHYSKLSVSKTRITWHVSRLIEILAQL